jgi:D-sedoheptulose 7-phosphate isomerase
MNVIENSLAQAKAVMERYLSDPDTVKNIAAASELMAESIRNGGKVITCGNGGSCCDAAHFAEELTGRYRCDRRPLPAICINDASHLTCVANDFGFEDVFIRSVEALGKPGDVLLAFSTSGNSENVVRAAQAAKKLGMKVVGMSRKAESKLAYLSDVLISVEHDGYADRIQEMHIMSVHIMIENIEHLLGL